MSSYRTKRRKINSEVEVIMQQLDSSTSPEYLHSSTLHLNSLQSNSNAQSIDAANLQCTQEPIHIVNPVDISIQQPLLRAGLAEWSVKNNITHASVSKLLTILNPFISDSENLPLCSKTLLGTPRLVKTCKIGGGKYFYFGIEQNLIKDISIGLRKSEFPIVKRIATSYNDSTILTIRVSTDGLPICKSSNIQLWPILIMLDQALNPRVRLVAVFCGETKPSNLNEFLQPFIDECSALENEGFKYNDAQYYLRISCIIADAPARSFIKGSKGHTAYHGCERCIEEGTWDGRIVFSSLAANLRTDESFKSMIDVDHHCQLSPFSRLEVGLVSQVALDYMHLICLGVTRKLLNLWICGPKANRLPSREVAKISSHLVSVSKCIPEEFARKPRTLRDINRYKATEFRQFLLYTGPAVLLRVLDKRKYKHFLLLHSATLILLSEKASYPSWNLLAQNLLRNFVKEMQSIYGNTTSVYNVHSLIHISDDARNYGSLENISAFPFENYLQKLKKLIRGQKLQLEQIVKRVAEIETNCIDITLPMNKNKVGAIGKKNNTCKKYYFRNIAITSKVGNNCFMTNGGSVLLICKILLEEEVYVECKEYLDVNKVSGYPFNSKLMCVYGLGSKMSNIIKLPVAELYIKCVLLPLSQVQSGNVVPCSKFICIPMIKSI